MFTNAAQLKLKKKKKKKFPQQKHSLRPQRL